MKFTPLGIDGAWLIESPLLLDDRGYFREWFKLSNFKEVTGINFSVSQANVSKSRKNVVRGIHFSNISTGQAKWVTCNRGAVIDYVVDLRSDSPTFKAYELISLQESDGRSIFISGGLGHGFVSLEDDSQITYMLSSEYSPEFEIGINPFDSELNINWESDSSSLILSGKDREAPNLSDILNLGKLPRMNK